MQTRDLDYFVSLSVTGNFTKTAKLFNVTQPTITLAIKRLEADFGTLLVIRNKQSSNVTLTAAGHQLLIHAQRIQQALQAAQNELAEIDQPTVQLGLPPIIGSYYFPKFVPRLQESNLLTRISPITVGSDKLLEELVNGTINIAMVAHTPLITQNQNWGLVSQKILLERHAFCIIDSLEHGFIKHAGAVTPNEILNFPFVALDDDFIHATVLKFLYSQTPLTKNIAFRTNEIQSLKALVANGAGIGLLTEVAINDDDQLATHPLKLENPLSFDIYLVYRDTHILTGLEKDLIEVFTNPS